MNIVILDSFAADQGEDVTTAWTELMAVGPVVSYPRSAPGDVVHRARGADAVVTNKVVLDAATLAQLPGLRYVGVSATGTNIVDIDAARAGGVAVTNVPGYSTAAVAQLVFAYLLTRAIDVGGHDAAVKAGAWAAAPDFCFFRQPMTELAGKTLVVIGKGAIGGAVARIGEAFGMNVVAAAVPGSSTADRRPLDEVLPGADAVTIHCPLTPATRHMVNDAFLAALKPTCVLVNTSRGPVVDEAALLRALREGRLGGVALDVLGQEPPPADHPLLQPNAPWRDRLLVTPHIGWGTVEARARLRTDVAANLRAFVQGERRHRVDL